MSTYKRITVLFRVTDKTDGKKSGEMCDIDFCCRMVSYHHSKREDGTGLCSQISMDDAELEMSTDDGKTWTPVEIPPHDGRRF